MEREQLILPKNQEVLEKSKVNLEEERETVKQKICMEIRLP